VRAAEDGARDNITVLLLSTAHPQISWHATAAHFRARVCKSGEVRQQKIIRKRRGATIRSDAGQVNSHASFRALDAANVFRFGSVAIFFYVS
jgi:hypothetical protein